MAARRSVVLLVAVLGVASGCTKTEEARVAPSCLEGPGAVTGALRAAPSSVRLADGTPLSACVRDADSGADLQNLGGALTRVGEDLEEAALAGDAEAAVQLGYLAGAARRGAPNDSEIQTELVRRLERSAALEGAPAAVTQAAERGFRAGERTG